MTHKYSIIACDFPYAFTDKLQMSDIKRGAKANYNTLTLEQLKLLPIEKLADPNGCILAMWCPSSLIKEGLELMDHYNFDFKQTYIWVKVKKSPLDNLRLKINKFMRTAWKTKEFSLREYVIGLQDILKACNLETLLSFGMGHLFRQCHEVCLIGINNNKIYKHLENKSQRSVSFAPNLKHSAKPEDLQNSLELMFPSAQHKIELFARRERPGWVCLGNEVGDCQDIFVSLNKLLGEEHGEENAAA